MRYVILVATSCVALSLAACSGGGAPSSGAPTPSEPTNGGGAVGGDYDSARTAVQSVLAEIAAIEGLPVDTAAQREAARARAAAARTRFDRALAALRSAAEDLAAGSQARAAADSYLRGITLADIPSRLSAAALRAADTWADIEGPTQIAITNPPPSAVFERFPRAQADGTVIPASDRLSVRTEAVMHSAGKTVFSSDGTGVTDELPMRSLTLRTAGAPGRRGDWYLQGRDGTPDRTGNTDGVLNYSVEITPGGLVYKAGGNAIYYDFQRRFDVGGSADAWFGVGPDGESGTDDDGAWSKGLDTPTNWVHDDIKLTFGSPSEPNSGVNAFYWNTRIPFPEGTTWETPAIVTKISDHGIARPDSDLGFYDLWISNFGGVDRGLENTDGTPHPSDDKTNFLEYAAYGLFMYVDTLVSSRTAGRQQGFHFGYDTFADEDDLRTTDIAAGDTVEATFSGATTAIQYLLVKTLHPNRHELRGDITLNARIGSGANKISGQITNLERRASDGSWSVFDNVVRGYRAEDVNADRLVLAGKDYPFVNVPRVDDPNTATDESTGTQDSYPSDYSAHGATINADGSYEGGVFLQTWDPYTQVWYEKSWDFDSYRSASTTGQNSIFGGTIYGPRDGNFEDIETAGYWFLYGDKRVDKWGGIIGSYGAVRID